MNGSNPLGGLAEAQDAELLIRKPCENDGSCIWKLVRDTGKLDVNSPYSYLMLGKYFRETCAIAELGRKPVGIVTGFLHPAKPDTWFVWQIAVDAAARGRGVAGKLLGHVLNREQNRNVKYIEATISPSNRPSQSLFLGFARRIGAKCEITEGFRSDLFPEGAHEDELLFRIGPMK